jgi:methionyl-tRNA synthetase
LWEDKDLETNKRYTVTAALIYANGPIHIGHLAGCYLPSDIFVRYLRKKGADVKFISGTDEHGVPITIKAKKENKTPQQVVDEYYEIINQSFLDFGIEFDIYSRTSREIHHKTSADFFTDLYNKGVFKEEVSEQYYDEEAKQFLADRYITGDCPKCGNPGAYGDQCEKCGSSLSSTELKNPKSALSGSKPILKPTKNWYLPLDKMQPEIEKFIDSHKDWKTNVYGQCKSWLNQGLQPRAMTRDLDWGVKVPLKDAEGKVLYVWFDAPIGYITATKELLPNDWEKYWKDKDTKLIHFIGKDNIVFHCIIFPAMLMAHGDYILPDNVPANEFLNLEGDKISTSRNWAVWLHEYLKELPNKQDELRYVLTSIAPEAKDSEFTWKDYQTRVNNELVAIFGNFVNRTLVLTHKYYNGIIPKTEISEKDQQIVEELKAYKNKIGALIENYRFREALSEAMNLARLGNKFLADTEPWKLIKTDEERVTQIMFLALQITANLAIVFEPFLPFTSKKLNQLLNISSLNWEDIGKIDILKSGHQINPATLLFEKIEDELIEQQIEKLKATAPPKIQHKPMITFDDFTKLEIRIGEIKEASKHPDADKLLVLKVDLGGEVRTIVSGIAEHYKAEEIITKKVSVLVNLAPRKIRGIESQGMILMAEDESGLAFISPEKAITNGAEVR